jgi:hypothetical protein
MKHVNALCGHNIEILSIQECVICSFRSERTAKRSSFISIGRLVV